MGRDAGVSLSTKRRRRSARPAARRDGGGGADDYISTLPDEVLGDIISLLPTKEGARTRILASRWRHLWLTAPLSLGCCGFGTGKFAVAAPLILSSHQGPGRRLCLHYYRCSLHPFNERFEAAVEACFQACLESPALHNLQELELQFNPVWKPVSAWASVFRSSSTLRVVQIEQCSLSDDATIQGLQFPLLKHLGLQGVELSECSLQNMVSGCPALECLMIHTCHGAKRLRINSPCLTRIGVTSTGFQKPHMLEELIIESAPHLEMLLIFNQNDNKDLHVLVLSAPKLQTLCCTTSGIVFGSKDIQGPHTYSLATMGCTIKYLALSMDFLSLDSVLQKLRCFPCLEELYLECRISGRTNSWRNKHRDLIRSLDLRLKKLVLTNYRGNNSDVDFVTFFVVNAPVLESMTLAVLKKNEEFWTKQRKKLQLENRASIGAQFHFVTRGLKLESIYNVRDLVLFDLFK